ARPNLDRVVDPLHEAARRRPSHPALVAGGRTVGCAELDAAADRAARRLAALGVGRGDRVATTLPPGHAFAELLHALPRLGAALVPLDARLPAPELRRRLDATGARLTVQEPLRGPEADAEPGARLDPDAVHTVVFTSGTGGAPKPVELTLRNHLASALGSAWALGVDPDDRWLCPLPVFHVGGLAVLLRSALYGTTAIVDARFDAPRVRASLESGEATLVSLVATMLARLREAGLMRAPALRAALLGGGPVPAGLLEWAAALGLPVRPTYGMTETASQVATAPPGELAAVPLPGVELRIAADGEILVRGPVVARDALGVDGWLHTGDAGSLDARGRLRVEGRLKELIVTGGEKVAPAEVEAALLAHPAVADAGVVGLADADWGEAVTAFVVLAHGASDAALLAHCRARLARHEVPKRIERVAALPRTATGKLLRDRLAGDTG
ncbi:MAG: AMP-binding protein, partial [Nocardioidaceae bacterium]